MLEIGCRPAQIDLVDQILVLNIKKINRHLAADHFDIRFQAQVT